VDSSPMAALFRETIAKGLAKQQNTTNLQEDTFYPTIFRYKCRGAFFATSDEPGSKGICRGIQTQLKHVRDLKRCTEQESIDIFLQATSNSWYQSTASTTKNEENAMTDEDGDVNLPPAVIYDFKTKKQTMAERFEENSRKGFHQKRIVEAGTNQALKDFHEKKVAEIRARSNLKTLKTHRKLIQKEQEETAKKIMETAMTTEEDEEWQDWYAYGSTEVHLLVLRDAKTDTERTMGIAPVCKYGFSVRDMGGKKHKRGTTTTLASLHVSPLEIAVGSSSTAEEEEEEETINEEETNTFSHRKQQMITDYEKRYKTDDNETKEKEGITFQKVYNQSFKITNAMKANAIMLRDSIKDDFPNRMYYSSQRITGQFGKTFDKTTKLMSDVFYQFWNNED